MFNECLRITSGLVANMGGLNIIKNRQNNLPLRLLTFKYFNKFIKTPLRISVVFRKNNYGKLCFLNGPKKCGRYLIPSLKIVIYICSDLKSGQSGVKMASESVACVLASKAKEYLMLLLWSRGR